MGNKTITFTDKELNAVVSVIKDYIVEMEDEQDTSEILTEQLKDGLDDAIIKLTGKSYLARR